MFSNNEVQRCENLKLFIHLFAYFLVDGGIFFLRYRSTKTDEILQLADQISKEVKWRNMFRDFKQPLKTWPSSVVCDYIENEGLSWEKQKECRMIITFQTLEEFKSYIAAYLPHLYHLKNTYEREDFLNELIITHTETHTDPYGKVYTEEAIVEINGYKPNKNCRKW